MITKLRALRNIIKIIIWNIRKVMSIFYILPYKGIILVDGKDYSTIDYIFTKLNQICGRTDGLIVKDSISIKDSLSNVPILRHKRSKDKKILYFLKYFDIFDIDAHEHYNEAWNWYKFVEVYLQSPDKKRRKEIRKRFISKIEKLKRLNLNKTYLIGTGPSLERASNIDFSDGLRIVCNTIVKDYGLCVHINPHFIVAGDAIYHFGFEKFPLAFRRDLRVVLEKTDAVFVYPELFDVLVSQEYKEFEDRLIPIPIGVHQNVCVDLIDRFELPIIGNVLNNLFLPLGCTLSDNIYLWGFDGRAPDDTLFWSNSNRHFYGEYVTELTKAHPAFYNYLVPKTDSGKYVRTHLGDSLEQQLSKAEKNGKKFVMMHFSWTEALKKRYFP